MGYNPLFRGSLAQGPTKSVQSNFQNGSGSTISKGIVVSLNASSQLVPLDISDEAQVDRLVGLTTVEMPDGSSAGIINTGRLEDITTAFSVGDAIYADADGALINVKPDIGVSGFESGDFVIFLGVIVKNEFDAMKKDLQLMIQVIGQL